MTTFNVGDIVWHKNRDDKQLGVVMKVKPMNGWSSIDVQWDEGTEISKIFLKGYANGHSSKFLVLHHKMLEYDPTQQGDTEDDI